jgi:hypothetical protein
MDLSSKVTAAAAGGDKSLLETALLACMDEGGNSGLSAAISLVQASFGEVPWQAELREGAAFAALNWKEDGIQHLLEVVTVLEDLRSVAGVLVVLAYAATCSLHRASLLRLEEYPALREQLNFLDEGYYAYSFTRTATDALFDAVDQLHPDEVAPTSIIQALLRLSLETELLTSADAFNIVFRAYSRRWLRQYN